MIKKATYFELQELVCPHVFEKLGPLAWRMIDPRLIETLDWIRSKINKPVFVNNWHNGGKFSQRGFRCTKCEIVRAAIEKDQLYLSAHTIGKAVDFDVQGLIAEEVRQWLIARKKFLPHPIRLENGVSWVHLDTFDNETGEKIVLFNP